MQFFMTVVHDSWRKLRRLDPPPAEARFARRGVVAVVDWEPRQIIGRASFHSPAGACFFESVFWVASNAANRIRVFDCACQRVRTILHPLFNDLHTLVPSGDRVLVTSSGTDAILELDSEGRLLWSWLATEHGFDRFRDGRGRTVERRMDWSSVAIETTEQTTHVNSAIGLGTDAVIATLFVQGMLIRIDRRSGTPEVLLSGMDRPHRIRPQTPGPGWTVCDSGASRVIILDERFSIVDEIGGDFLHWVQDAVVVGSSLFILDANNCRMIEWDLRGRRMTASLEYPESWKGFGITVVPKTWEALLPRIATWSEEYVRSY